MGIQIYEQISLFDLFPEESPAKQECMKYPRLIREAATEMFHAIGGHQEDESYRVWGHVPALGKRYEAFFRDVESIDDKKIDEIVDKYKKLGLEISLCKLYLKGNYMITTMWTTKGHMEVLP